MRLWSFIPQREFTESLEWKTDITKAKGSEEAIALRETPRQGFMFKHLMNPQQFSRAKAFTYGSSQNETLIPMWQDFETVGNLPVATNIVNCDTTVMDITAGGYAVLLDEDDAFEILQVDSVSGTSVTFAEPTTRSYAHAIIAPARAVWFAQPVEFSRGADDYVTVNVRFEAVVTSDLPSGAVFPAYRGFDVMTDRNVVVGDARERLVREVDVIDSLTGVLAKFPTRSYPMHSMTVSWDTLTRQELWRIRRWLHRCKGRRNGFWFPSWNQDLVLAEDISAGSNNITVQPVGYPEFYGIRDVMIQTFSGAQYFRRVLGGTSGVGGEVLTLNAPLGVSLVKAEVEMIMFMNFVRLDADRVEIKHRAARGASISTLVVEVPTP